MVATRLTKIGVVQKFKKTRKVLHFLALVETSYKVLKSGGHTSQIYLYTYVEMGSVIRYSILFCSRPK